MSSVPKDMNLEELIINLEEGQDGRVTQVLQFFLSLDDGLLKIFAPDRMKALMQSFGGMKKGRINRA